MQQQLINWYKQNKRDFPWRKDDDPYHIWISEIMLQQTTTEAVIPYYNRFLETFPTIKDLSEASLQDVYKLWEGLGYYRRARFIHETADIITEKFNGIFPENYDDIINLKGIGTYTAGAISSIAFHKCIPAVDGNVLRIMSRYYEIEENIALSKTQKKINDIVFKLIQNHDASSFNQGLMDLGATICRPKKPKCEICPINKNCKALKNKQQDVLPVNIKKIKHKELNYITGIITYQDKILVEQNKSGLLEDLYGFVQYNLESPYSFIEKFKEEYNKDIEVICHIKDIKHVFSHQTWYMHVYHFVLKEDDEKLSSMKTIDELPFSTAHRKVLKAYLEQL